MRCRPAIGTGYRGTETSLRAKDFRGRGVGRSLIEKALDFARQANYRVVRLDTLREMDSAIALYTAFGFKEIPPYNTGGVESVQYFELNLRLGERPDAPPSGGSSTQHSFP
jgi:predicted N-acetyltransferase YhbS